MSGLLHEANVAVRNELNRAQTEHGHVNSSHHESYAIILEELQEAEDACNAFSVNLSTFWACVKQNKPDECIREVANVTKEMAIKAVMEWIQIAAMCEKARLTADNKMGVKK
jgi:hypothetical protein